MAKETDLLKDPLALAQQRYKDQISSFKDEFIPKPSTRKSNQFLAQHGLNPVFFKGKK